MKDKVQELARQAYMDYRIHRGSQDDIDWNHEMPHRFVSFVSKVIMKGIEFGSQLTAERAKVNLFVVDVLTNSEKEEKTLLLEDVIQAIDESIIGNSSKP